MNPDSERQICNEAQRLFDARMDEVPDWVWETDLGAIITYSNRAVEEVLGYEKHEVIGRSGLEFVTKEDLPGMRSLLERASKTGQVEQSITAHVLRKNGEVRTVEVNAKAIRDGEGKLTGLRNVTRDITEQVDESKAGRERLANYKAITDNSPTGVVILQNGRVIYANPELVKVMGYSLEEASELDVWTVVHPDDVDRVKSIYRARMTGLPAPDRYEIRATTKSGETRHLELRATLIQYNGAPAVLDSIIDITDRKVAEDALRESEGKYRKLVEDVSDWVWEVDENAIYTYASPRVRTLLGREPDEVVGKTPFDLMPPEEAKRVAAEFEPIAARREAFQLLENTLLHRDGHEVVVETNGTPVFDAEGRFKGYRGTDRDITEKVRVTNELKARTMELQAILDAFPDIYFWLDEEMRVIDYHAHSPSDLYVPPEIFLGKRAQDFLPPGIAEKAGHATEQAYLTGVTQTAVIDLPMPGGTRTYESRTVPIARKRALVVIRDITERKVAEKTLRESEERYRRLVDLAPVAIFVNLRGKFAFLNTEALAVFGASTPEDLIGKQVLDFIGPDHREIIKARIASMVEGNATSVPLLQESFLRLDGSRIDAEVTASRITYQGELALLVVFRDITERVKSEAALRESEGKFRSIVETTNEWIWEVNMEGRNVYSNPAVQNILGYAVEEVQGASMFALMHDDDLAHARAIMIGSMARNEGWSDLVVRWLHKDGGYRWLESNAVPVLDDAGNVVALRGADRDITERKLAEEALQYRLDLEGIITTISTRFINLTSSETDSAIDGGLETVARFIGADRSYVFLVREGGRILRNTHEWCAEGVESWLARRQDLPANTYKWAASQLRNNQAVHVPNVRDMPPEAAADKDIALARGALSFVLAPMFWQGSPAGFIGFDSMREQKSWSNDAIALLRVVGEVFISAISRMRAEAALLESEKTYKNLVETTDTGYVMLDEEGRVVDANVEYVRLTGRGSLDEIAGHSVLEWTAQYDLERNAHEVKKCGETGRVRNLGIDYVWPDGAVMPIEINATVIETRDGPRILSLCRDSTERRRAEQQIAEISRLKEQLLLPGSLSEKLKLITDRLVETLEADFARIWVVKENSQCEEACQLAKAEEGVETCPDHTRCLHLMASSGRYTRLDGIHRQVALGAYKIGRIAAGGEPKFVTNDVTHDPHVHDRDWARELGLVSFAGFRLPYPEGDPIGVLAIFSKRAITPYEESLLEDIARTASHVVTTGLAEEALRDSEERYRRLVDLSPVAIFVNLRGRFAFLNEAAVAAFGAPSPEEMIGREVLDFIAPSFREIVRDRVQLLSRGGAQSVPLLQESYLRLDGSEIDTEVAATRITYEGETAFLVVFRDITERKRDEERQRALERQLEAQKRQFYRETILSVTDGKLNICEPPEIRPYLSTAELRIRVSTPAEVAPARHEIERYCRDHGTAPERLEPFMIGVGEAITNAIKHAEAGHIYAGVNDGAVWVGVVDRGCGISSLILPRATLLRGFSTKPSLGLGYTIMLEVADKILLRTGERGTIVILVRSIEEPAVEVGPAQLPDTWDSAPS